MDTKVAELDKKMQLALEEKGKYVQLLKLVLTEEQNFRQQKKMELDNLYDNILFTYIDNFHLDNTINHIINY
jgi:hypothetical protein